MLTSFKNKREKIEENIYFIAFGINLAVSIFGSSKLFSLFELNERTLIANTVQYSCILLLGIKFILHDQYLLKDLLIKGILFLCGLLTLRHNGMSIFMIFLFIICADNIDFKKLVRISFFITLTMTGIIIFLAKVGYIENLIYYRGGRIRESFGFQYVTVFASHIFYILAMYFYFKKSKVRLVEMIISVGIAFFISYRCDARLSTISILLLVLFIGLSDYYPRLLNNRIIKQCIKNSFWLFSTIIITLSYIFIPSGWLLELNGIMAGRLSLGKETFFTYPIKLFGQKIVQYGWGGKVEHDITKDYFYIDASYLRLLFMYGLIIFVIYGFIFYFLYKKAYDNKDYRFVMILLVISITGMIDENMIKILNIFMFYLFAKVSIHNDSKILVS